MADEGLTESNLAEYLLLKEGEKPYESVGLVRLNSDWEPEFFAYVVVANITDKYSVLPGETRAGWFVYKKNQWMKI